MEQLDCFHLAYRMMECPADCVVVGLTVAEIGRLCSISILLGLLLSLILRINRTFTVNILSTKGPYLEILHFKVLMHHS